MLEVQAQRKGELLRAQNLVRKLRDELVTVTDVLRHFEGSQVFEMHGISLQLSTHQIAEMSELEGNLAIT
jgi:hypothetical protein